jgi:uncharacterized membrane protein YcjF (UPF0283 family)
MNPYSSPQEPEPEEPVIRAKAVWSRDTWIEAGACLVAILITLAVVAAFC